MTLLKKPFVMAAILFGLFALLTLPAHAQDGALSDMVFEDEINELTLDDDDYLEDEVLVEDPYSKFNHTMFNINQKVYENIFSPLAKGYDFIMPKPVQKGINTFARYVNTPERFCNNLLQLKFKSALIEASRFVINGSIGVGGIFNPAEKFFHLKQQSEDFGQTLAHYNVGSGPYFVWPIVGPSTGRDTVGTLVDNVFDPFFWLSIYDVHVDEGSRLAYSMTKRVNNYNYNIRDSYNRIVLSAFDPYTALQNAYIQNRNKRIAE